MTETTHVLLPPGSRLGAAWTEFIPAGSCCNGVAAPGFQVTKRRVYLPPTSRLGGPYCQDVDANCCRSNQNVCAPSIAISEALNATIITTANTCRVGSPMASLPAVYSQSLRYRTQNGVYKHWNFSDGTTLGADYCGAFTFAPNPYGLFVCLLLNSGDTGGCDGQLKIYSDRQGPATVEDWYSAVFDISTIQASPFYLRFQGISLAFTGLPGQEDCTNPYGWTGDIVITEE
jgi:hypothetical protein